MARSEPFIKWRPDRWKGGTRDLPPLVRLVYFEMINEMYLARGELRLTDLRWLPQSMRMTRRTVARAVDHLRAAGKLWIDTAGRFRNDAADRILRDLGVALKEPRHPEDDGIRPLSEIEAIFAHLNSTKSKASKAVKPPKAEKADATFAHLNSGKSDSYGTVADDPPKSPARNSENVHGVERFAHLNSGNSMTCATPKKERTSSTPERDKSLSSVEGTDLVPAEPRGPADPDVLIQNLDHLKSECYRLAAKAGRRSAPKELERCGLGWPVIFQMLNQALMAAEPRSYLGALLNRQAKAAGFNGSGRKSALDILAESDSPEAPAVSILGEPDDPDLFG